MAVGKNQSVGRMSPRQKMINLMYIVLTAMLALNVSSDVLNGFSQVEDGLTRSNRTITARNQALFAELRHHARAEGAHAVEDRLEHLHALQIHHDPPKLLGALRRRRALDVRAAASGEEIDGGLKAFGRVQRIKAE